MSDEQKLKQKDINKHCMSKAKTNKKLENKMHAHQKSGNDNEDSLSNRTVEKDIEFSDFKKKEKYNEREENRIRIRKIRENQTHEQRLHERKKLKDRMKLVRARKSEEQILQDNEEARDRMRKVWEKK